MDCSINGITTPFRRLLLRFFPVWAPPHCEGPDAKVYKFYKI
jgi:hypothetical protein